MTSDPPGGMGPLAWWTSNFQIQAKSLGTIYFAAKGHSDEGVCACHVHQILYTTKFGSQIVQFLSDDIIGL